MSITSILLILPGAAAAFLLLLILYAYCPFKRPLLTESDLSNREWFFFFYNYYAAKYLMPMKRSRRGSPYGKDFFMIEAAAAAPPLNTEGCCTINAVGDIMFRKDFAGGVNPELWDAVSGTILNADYTMGNMEFAVNDSEVIEKTIQFSIKSAIADRLLKPGDRFYDYLSIANNHINDSLSAGVDSSIAYLKERGISFSGARHGDHEAPDFPLADIEGVKTAILAYSFSTNGVPLETGPDYGVNLVRFNALDEQDYDPRLVHQHIEAAKRSGAELIIAQLHWGVEFEYYPPARIIERGQALMDAGIDIIIGHHPHMLNPAQWYLRADGSRCLCLYSLGNITSSTLPFPMQNLSLSARISIARSVAGGRAEPAGAVLTPLYFSRCRKNGRIAHRVLPLYEALERPEEYRLSVQDKLAMKRCRREFGRYLRQDRGFQYS